MLATRSVRAGAWMLGIVILTGCVARQKPQVFVHRTIDDVMARGPAATVLVPEGWTLDAKVIWRTSPLQADLGVRVSDPDGSAQFTRYPASAYMWNAFYGAMSSATTAPLSASGVVIRKPPADAAGCITTVLIPQIHPKTECRIVSQAVLPRLADYYRRLMAIPSYTTRVDAAVVRVEYDEAGRTFEEDIYCILWVAEVGGSQTWMTPGPGTLRHEKGRLAEAYPTLQTIGFSITPDRQWYEKLVRAARSVQGDLRATPLSITTAGSAWEQAMGAQRTTNALVNEHTQATVAFRRADGAEVDLPAGAASAWLAGDRYFVSYTKADKPPAGHPAWMPLQRAGRSATQPTTRE